MALQKSDAIVLKAYNWSESSRTIVFFTRDFGRLALIDKGGRSLKSRRGRMLAFTKLEVTFYQSQRETSGYVSDILVERPFEFAREGTLGRLGYGSAACELLLLLLADEEPQPELFDYTVHYLNWLDKAEKRYLPALFVAFFLRLLSTLGYHPSLTHCSVSGQSIADEAEARGEVAFSPEQGGVVSAACQKAGDCYIRLTYQSLKLLVTLQTASLREAGTLPISFVEAGVLVEALCRFMSFQAGVRSEIKSLEFLEKLKNNQGGNGN
jgi:DNA repair protein RecO (recombination protein O)